MKIKKLLYGVAAIIAVALIISLWPHGEPGSSYLAEVGILVPASAITDYQEGPFMLTSSEYMISLKLAPSQIPALIKQIQTKERYEIGSYSRDLSARMIHVPYVAKFFAVVPKTATGAIFEVIHRKGEKTEWTTECFFAIDKPTGRVWFYGWEVYN